MKIGKCFPKVSRYANGLTRTEDSMSGVNN